MSEATVIPNVGRLNEIVAGNIRAEVSRAGMSQARLARALGMARALVSNRWNERTPWTVAEIEQVASILGIEPHRLLIPVDTQRRGRNSAAASMSVHRLGLEPRTPWLKGSAGRRHNAVTNLAEYRARRVA